MTVYIDVLFFTNAIIDFFLIQLTSLISKHYIKPLRLIISSVVASFFSLSVFLKIDSMIIEVLMKFIFSFLICIIAFSIKKIFKHLVIFLLVSSLFGGIMSVIVTLLKPRGMFYEGGTVYFDISPLQLIIISTIIYFFLRVIKITLKSKAPLANRCSVSLENEGKNIEIQCLVDSGNSLVDIYKDRPVIIVEKNIIKELYYNGENEKYVFLPITTVNNDSIIKAFPCKKAKIGNKKEQPVLLAESSSDFNDDFKGIVNPQYINL